MWNVYTFFGYKGTKEKGNVLCTVGGNERIWHVFFSLKKVFNNSFLLSLRPYSRSPSGGMAVLLQARENKYNFKSKNSRKHYECSNGKNQGTGGAPRQGPP
ncbi:MAG: hypothetical protein K2N13_00060, partial [Paraprevotella sp.]|nr:hypothetical protein [Paraprevotella sp.]